MRQHGCSFDLADTETCNHSRYACPVCKASDRDRLYALYIDRYLGLRKQGAPVRLLDIAPSRPLSEHIRRRLRETGPGTEYRTADYAMKDVDDRVDVMDMGLYPDNDFDFLCCSHVLEHVADDRKALRELYRVLKPGGEGIIMVPIILKIEDIDEDPSITDPNERWKRFGQDDHVRVYSKQGFVQRMSEAGFAVRQYGQEYFGRKALRRYGIATRSILYVGEKPAVNR